MRILFVGDVVAPQGCEHLRRVLPAFKKMQNIDFCIVNGENSAQGNGILPGSCDHILDSGADLITTGNHALKRVEIEKYFENENIPVIRPLNFHRSAPGKGYYVLERKGMRLGVINLMGRIYMDACENPFDEADRILSELNSQGIKNILIDFHGEATSEKRVMGFYLDGKVSAVLGTHTHIQTSDAQILPQGTAYITDTGMTGVINSVLGVEIGCATKKVITGLPIHFKNPEGECQMDCVIVETDNKTGRAVSIERFNIQ
ncbi:MAG: TIGR00282 family metallophosphoesterase [Clostridia bacterium]|nr:TIGR00282 family metallophosphoesterase [Clostridia bacterium]